MAYTQTQLDTLTAAIAEGVLKVKYEDREVVYRSLDDMLALKRRIETELGVGTKPPLRSYAVFKKGL